MSRANAQVKFPDGTVRYGIYNGTVDVYWKYLFDTAEKAWEAWHEYYQGSGVEPDLPSPKLTGGIEDVEIADDYGGGDTYKGRATKQQICSDTDTDNMINVHHGLPNWWDPGDDAPVTGMESTDSAGANSPSNPPNNHKE